MATAVKLQPLTQRAAWKALETHHEKIKTTPLRSLFSDDPQRAARFTIEAAGLFLDYSKNRITDETRKLLLQLAQESGLRERIDAMFRGEKINITENRAVLHVALRAPKGESIIVDGEDVVPGVHAVLDKMAAFSDRVRSGAWKGHTGKRIRNVINIGIGGSDLGPVMAYEALKYYSDRNMIFRFVSNVDGTDFAEAVIDLDPDGNPLHRLLQNLHHPRDHDQRAHRARLGAQGSQGDETAVAKHFVAVSTNADRSHEIRHRHRQHVRLLGLGRRPLLHGLRHRPLHHAGHRPGQFPRHAQRLPPDGRAFPHRALREAICPSSWAC